MVELVLAGLVTNDTLETWRSIVSAAINADQAHPALSSLETELATRLGPRPLTSSRYREAKQRVARRLDTRAAAAAPTNGGRWSLVHRSGVLGAARTDEDRADRLARVLLVRYGVVTRDSLEHEVGAWDWSQLYRVFQRMELRGEVRRGYFVAGMVGVQFALPEAVEKLRAAGTLGGAVTLLNAMDPANVFGGDSDGPRFARVPSTHVALLSGQPVAVFEDNGERITTMPDAAADVIQRAVAEYLARPFAPRRQTVTSWNGAPVLGGAGKTILGALGFRNTPGGMESWL